MTVIGPKICEGSRCGTEPRRTPAAPDARRFRPSCRSDVHKAVWPLLDIVDAGASVDRLLHRHLLFFDFGAHDSPGLQPADQHAAALMFQPSTVAGKSQAAPPRRSRDSAPDHLPPRDRHARTGEGALGNLEELPQSARFMIPSPWTGSGGMDAGTAGVFGTWTNTMADFSIRHVEVKRSRAIFSPAFNVHRGVLLLFGIGSSALSAWDRKNEAAQSERRPDRYNAIDTPGHP